MSIISGMDVLKHNHLNCPSQRKEKKEKKLGTFFSAWACVLQLTVLLCKWTGISMLWKEESLGWREQVKITLWIISPPGPCHCCCPHTWQGQKEKILLSWLKPVLLVYRLKRGKRRGNILMESRASVAAERLCASWKGSVGWSHSGAHHLPSSFSFISPSALPALFLCLSLSAARWLSSPGSIQAEASRNKE